MQNVLSSMTHLSARFVRIAMQNQLSQTLKV